MGSRSSFCRYWEPALRLCAGIAMADFEADHWFKDNFVDVNYLLFEQCSIALLVMIISGIIIIPRIRPSEIEISTRNEHPCLVVILGSFVGEIRNDFLWVIPTNWSSIWPMFWHSIWHSVILPGILFDIDSNILSGILFDISSDILSGILRHRAVPRLRSGRVHWDPELAVSREPHLAGINRIDWEIRSLVNYSPSN